MRNRKGLKVQDDNLAIVPATSTTSRDDANLSSTAMLIAETSTPNETNPTQPTASNEEISSRVLRNMARGGIQVPSRIIKGVLTLLVGDLFSAGSSPKDPSNQPTSAPSAPRLGGGTNG